MLVTRILSALLFVSAIASAADRPLFEQYPHTDLFRLKKGNALAETVKLPVHIQDYDWAFLAGAGNQDELRALLDKEDLDLTEIQPGTGLNMGIFAINYKESDVGPFHEYYLVVAAKDRSIEGARVPENRNLGYYVWDIQMDSDLAIRFGRQVWGHPKTFAYGSVDWAGSDFAFDFKEKSGANIVSGKCASCANLSYTFARLPSFFFVTPYQIRRSWAEAINEGEIASRAFDAAKDKLEWNSQTRMGKKLTKVGFKPFFWTMGRHVKAVGLK